MTTQASLLHAICENPDDDDVRLVYADWLDDHGQSPRAEFIRGQIELARMGWAESDPEAEPIRSRMRSSVTWDHEALWQKELLELPEGLGWGYDFRRGFVDTLRASDPQKLLEWEDAILETVPLRRIELVDWRPENSLTGTKLLGRVRELGLWNTRSRPCLDARDDALVVAVSAWPEVQHFNHLELQQLELSTSGLEALGEAEFAALSSLNWQGGLDIRSNLEPTLTGLWWRQLVSLRLADIEMSIEDVRQLAQRLSPERLRRLSFLARLEDPHALALADSGILANLNFLDVTANAIGSEGLCRIVDALPESARFCCDCNPIGDTGFASLASSPLFARQTNLVFHEGTIGDRGVVALANSPYAQNLQQLELVNQQITSEGARALLTSSNLKSLRSLNLDANPINRLPACQHPLLEDLHLSQINLAPRGAVEFARESRLPALQVLDLSDAHLDDQTLEALANATGFSSLRQLDFSNNPLGDAGATGFMSGQGLLSLESLDLVYCGITAEAVRSWKDSPRLAQLRQLSLKAGNPIDEESYLDFCKRALRQGCDVDLYASCPWYRTIRRARDGTLAAEDRRALPVWINAIRTYDAGNVGILRASDFQSLCFRIDDPTTRDFLQRYASEPPTLELQREIIRIFLCDCSAEFVDTAEERELDADTFHPIGKDEAFAIVDAILARTNKEATGPLDGSMPAYISEREPITEWREGSRQLESISYEQLRTWFTRELFDLEQATFFRHSPRGEPRESSDASNLRVIGLDNDVIAMMWYLCQED